uniref:Peptidylprolyl isomerase n=1 Tax=Romanomermis culicivorax TaxID=13658 RepID=A0A915IC40_ROMCU
MNGYLSTKRVLYAGNGDVVDFKDGFKVFFNYKVETFGDDGNDRSCIDDSKLPYPNGYGKPMELIFGKQFKLAFWENCLKTMRLDEISSFTLQAGELLDYPFVSKQLRDISKKELMKGDDSHHHHHSCMGMTAASGGLGYAALDNWLKSPRSLIFTFHLLEILAPEKYERESWSLTAEEKILSLDRLKCEGNELFVAGRYEAAFQKYCEALTRLDSLILAEKPGEPEYLALDNKKVVFYTNIAECKLKNDEFYAAVEACDEALKREPKNVKALFRRGKAHLGAWNFGSAKKDLEEVLKLDDRLKKAVEKQLEILADREAAQKLIDAQQFKNMFK